MNANNLQFQSENNYPLTVDEILRLDDDIQDTNSQSLASKEQLDENLNAESEIEPVTKHTVITSPWSRLGMVGIPLSGGFLVFFLLLNSIINGGNQAQKAKPNITTEQTAQETFLSNDGDVYAQLALSKQASELDKIDSQKNKTQIKKIESTALPKQEVAVSRRSIAVASSPLPPPRTISRDYSPPAPSARAYREQPRNYSVARPQSITTAKAKALQAIDPISELNRLRSLGSFGKIDYTSSAIDLASNEFPESNTSSETQTAKFSQTPSRDLEATPILENTVESPTSKIEKIRPRWSNKQEPTDLKVADNDSVLSQMNQKKRYLVVGQFASGVLLTPLVKESSTSLRESQPNPSRYLAKLTQDLHDNYGQVVITKGTLLAVSVDSVDGASYAKAQVTSIIKDNTEYPISNGAISILGEGANPLVVRPFKDKGGELASQDLTVGLVNGVSKIGEILNQSDSSSSTVNSATGTFSSSVTSNSQRNIGGAFLEGAFGSLGKIIGRRAETSTQEIAARTSIWYVPKGTKITFMVNRTLELP
ncbi:Cell division protein DedD (plasmid) [Nostoc flagelliforme CCNUN1]|uniref:Cell division protein DedD n=1 Tax=Nostoc flagelliforme CCNUN1 TaxID=2038116 RepID=A0A2K8T955_9NOSO|nr:TrbI/VirB10 family protein [Nostoc flagelliforme]AUB44237.1 Cell division protein DedD [Nostoc flagelliforme CCNUN1]